MNTNKSVDQTLRTFVAEHPDGWDHHEWQHLLGELAARGADTSDPDAIGSALERTRLATVLADRGIKGLGPKRIDAIVDRFGTLWAVRHARAEDFAAISTIPTRLAEELERTLAD